MLYLTIAIASVLTAFGNAEVGDTVAEVRKKIPNLQEHPITTAEQPDHLALFSAEDILGWEGERIYVFKDGKLVSGALIVKDENNPELKASHKCDDLFVEFKRLVAAKYQVPEEKMHVKLSGNMGVSTFYFENGSKIKVLKIFIGNCTVSTIYELKPRHTNPF
ncbi:MAG: hypothetical protein DHS20C05_18220 [Hyphococcus sp.]|nr:MAG: hypothetical protein DHS20C05_18220 [Marinicaulis sp.]